MPSWGVSELRFADALNGWAFRPELWATHDGGAHWHRVPAVTTPIGALAAAAGHALAVVSSGNGVRVLRAAVGSDAWSQVASFPGSDYSTYSTAEPSLALSGTSAWLADSSALRVSTDGVHWRTVRGTCPAFGGGLGSVWLTSMTAGVLACGGVGGLGQEEKAVYGSSDGGRAFTLLGRPPRGGDLNSVAANQRFTVLVAASSGGSELYASFDGGRHYSVVLELSDGRLGLARPRLHHRRAGSGRGVLRQSGTPMDDARRRSPLAGDSVRRPIGRYFGRRGRSFDVEGDGLDW